MIRDLRSEGLAESARQSSIPRYNDLADAPSSTKELFLNGNTKGIAHLSRLKKVETIHLSRAKHDLFEEVIARTNVSKLDLFLVRSPNLRALQQAKKLRELSIHSNPVLSSLDDLRPLPLKSLHITCLLKLMDLDPVGDLPLEEFRLHGGMGRAMALNTLEPLGRLQKLKLLSLWNLSVRNDGLAPLSNLKKLSQLSISNQFPTEEYARLSVLLPNTYCERFKAWTYISTTGQTLGGKNVMVTGGRKRFLHDVLDRAKLQKVEEEFRLMQQTIAAEASARA